MGVFKEEIIDLEHMWHKQVPVYLDSCDRGVMATPEVKARMREIVTSLPGMAKPIWKFDHGKVTQREYKSTVEWGGGDATEVRLLYVNDRPHKKEFFSIHLKSVRMPNGEDY